MNKETRVFVFGLVLFVIGFFIMYVDVYQKTYYHIDGGAGSWFGFFMGVFLLIMSGVLISKSIK